MIGGLTLAVIAGIVFKEKVIPPTPLLFWPAGEEAKAVDPARVTGIVTTDTAFAANGGSRIAGNRVVFEAGARTGWHSHPRGQLLVVVEGGGWVQDAGGPKRALAPGDTVWTAPGVLHWHGANRTTRMTQLAIAEPDITGKVVEDAGVPVDARTYRAPAGSQASPPEPASDASAGD